MEIAELAGKVDALTEALNSFIANASPILEALKPEEAPEVDVVEAVIAANKAASDLPEALRDEVVESVRNEPTLDVAALVAKKTELVESIRANVTEAAGFIVGGAPKYASATDIGKVLS